jgi:steroid delta-isomerase
MEVADKIAAVHKYVEAFDTGNMELIRELYADDAVVEDPVGTDPYQGIDAILGFYQPSLGSEVRLELTGAPRCTGNAVAFPFQAVIGEMKIEIIDIFEFNEAGKVISMKAYWGPENTV